MKTLYLAGGCFSGVTPAQQAGSMEMTASGMVAFSSSALDATQMSVQRPTSSKVRSPPSASYASFIAAARSVEPNVGLLKTWSSGMSAAISGRICQIQGA